MREIVNKTLSSKSHTNLSQLPFIAVCDILYQLLQDKPVPRLVEEDEIEEQDRRKLEQQPKVYLPRDLDIIETVGK